MPNLEIDGKANFTAIDDGVKIDKHRYGFVEGICRRDIIIDREQIKDIITISSIRRLHGLQRISAIPSACSGVS